MRRFVLSLGLIAGLSAPCAAFAEDTATPTPAPAPTAPAKPGEEDPNRVVCTREHVVGSNRPKKVCLTVAQREEIRDRAKRNMDDSRRTPGSAASLSGTGSPY